MSSSPPTRTTVQARPARADNCKSTTTSEPDAPDVDPSAGDLVTLISPGALPNQERGARIREDDVTILSATAPVTPELPHI
ncbi:hypothetical protein AB0368_09405 [Actinoplanes sp. NPDC051475]|uniref:hypothetical protein n=1 Tax=Actinoplanes sp. NPDC051475 TaxID=3157225 RepID=UPI00344CAAAC